MDAPQQKLIKEEVDRTLSEAMGEAYVLVAQAKEKYAKEAAQPQSKEPTGDTNGGASRPSAANDARIRAALRVVVAKACQDPDNFTGADLDELNALPDANDPNIYLLAHDGLDRACELPLFRELGRRLVHEVFNAATVRNAVPKARQDARETDIPAAAVVVPVPAARQPDRFVPVPAARAPDPIELAQAVKALAVSACDDSAAFLSGDGVSAALELALDHRAPFADQISQGLSGCTKTVFDRIVRAMLQGSFRDHDDVVDRVNDYLKEARTPAIRPNPLPSPGPEGPPRPIQRHCAASRGGVCVEWF